MLGVFTPNPIDDKTVLFLTKARSKFNHVAKRWARKKSSKNITSLGGEAPLTEIYGIIVNLFAKDRSAGERIITQIQP